MRWLALLLVLTFIAAVSLPLLAQSPNDDRIYDEVRRKLANDPDVKGGTFQVDVKDGIVTVKGTVEKPKFRDKAERLVKKVKGVKSVVNQITVKVP